MDYEYDVFISYERNRRCQYWVPNYFLPVLYEELSNHLGKRAKIFLDRKAIRAGADWERTILSALATSRCLVPVLSGTYFTSEWCSREFAIVHNRQTRCGYVSDEHAAGLIVPVLVRDGEHLPEAAKRLQSVELHDYYTSSTALRESLDYREFEGAVDRFAKSVAQAIVQAPKECDPSWRERRWTDIDVEKVLDCELPTAADITINQAPRIR